MSALFHLPEEILSEFSIDNEGKTYASQSGVARLCGVAQSSINELLEKLAIGKPVSESLQPFAGIDYRAIGKLPDLVVSAIANHYAFYARKTTAQAKKVCLCFQTVGLRSWLREELGWKEQPATPTLSLEDTIALANFAASSAQSAGVSIPLAESIKLNSVMQIRPEAEPLLLPQKNAIASANPLEEKALSPTQIAEQLTQRLGIAKISARAVNKKLLELNYQVSIKRVRKSTGKQVHDYYKATPKGEQYCQLEMATYKAGDGNSTKYQLRWFSQIIDILVNYWLK